MYTFQETSTVSSILVHGAKLVELIYTILDLIIALVASTSNSGGWTTRELKIFLKGLEAQTRLLLLMLL